MSSPFATAKEFMEAKGPIYTFANNSTISTLLLVMSLVITIYFFYASFAMYKKDAGGQKVTPLMGVILVAGIATSLAGSLLGSAKPAPTTHSSRPVMQQTSSAQPVTMLLGLMGSAGTVIGRQVRLFKRGAKTRSGSVRRR